MGAGASLDAPMPTFPNECDMLVQPFPKFVEQGRIMKSTADFRKKAMKKGSLVKFDKNKHKAIFLSHTWWDRGFVDETNDPNDPYDKGAPDWQSGENKDLKFRAIVNGVRTLIEQKGWSESKVVLWIDWTVRRRRAPAHQPPRLCRSVPASCRANSAKRKLSLALPFLTPARSLSLSPVCVRSCARVGAHM